MSWPCSRPAHGPACCAAWATTKAWHKQLATYQTRFGDWRELFLELAKIDKVSKADIRRVAAKAFVDSNRTYAMIETATPTAAPQAKGGGQ